MSPHVSLCLLCLCGPFDFPHMFSTIPSLYLSSADIAHLHQDVAIPFLLLSLFLTCLFILQFHTHSLGSNFLLHLFNLFIHISITRNLFLPHALHLILPWYFKLWVCPPVSQRYNPLCFLQGQIHDTKPVGFYGPIAPPVPNDRSSECPRTPKPSWRNRAHKL